MAEKRLTTRIVLTHDEYSALSTKVLKAGEPVLAKVGTTEANGSVSEPIWMMKIGDGEKTVTNLPWLVAPAADVYAWAKKASLDAADVPTLEISKINGLQDAIDALAAEDERLAGLIAGKADAVHTHTVSEITDYETDVAAKIKVETDARVEGDAATLDAAKTYTDDKVTTVVNGSGFAKQTDLEGVAGRVTTAEDKITDLETAVNTTIPATYVKASDYTTKVAALEKADTDEAAAREALAGRVGTLETASATHATKTELTDGLATKVDSSAYTTKVGELEAADSALDTAVKAAQADATAAKEAIEAFLDDNAVSDGVINTLKEINEQLASGETNAETLAGDIQKNKDDIAAEVTAREEADEALQANIDKKADTTTVEAIEGRVATVEGIAGTAVQQITTTTDGGLKVTGKNQIDIDDAIVFVLDGGTAANL